MNVLDCIYETINNAKQSKSGNVAIQSESDSCFLAFDVGEDVAFSFSINVDKLSTLKLGTEYPVEPYGGIHPHPYKDFLGWKMKEHKYTGKLSMDPIDMVFTIVGIPGTYHLYVNVGKWILANKWKLKRIK